MRRSKAWIGLVLAVLASPATAPGAQAEAAVQRAAGTLILDSFPVSSTPVRPDRAPYGYESTFGDPRAGGRRHEGVDIIAPRGAPVLAVWDGTISKTSYTGLGGNGIWLARSDATYAVYLHLDSFAVEAGTRVRAGQVIGYVGSTGSSSTPHLHFELHPSGGRAIDVYPALVAADPLKPRRISSGSTDVDSSGIYVVKSGDSLWSIAVAHNLSVSRLTSFNGITASSVIYPGQKLAVKDSARTTTSPTAAPPTVTSPAAPSPEPNTYTVRVGDSMWRIAITHGLTVNELAALNGMKITDLIYPGRVLKVKAVPTSPAESAPAESPPAASRPATTVPGTTTPATTGGQAEAGWYIVRSGDSLWSIALAHGMSMAQLADLNGLTLASTLQPGQQLRLVGFHTVTAGESLWGIAASYGLTLQDLLAASGLSAASIIRPGQRITLP
jgi:LysM repeat protein